MAFGRLLIVVGAAGLVTAASSCSSSGSPPPASGGAGKSGAAGMGNAAGRPASDSGGSPNVAAGGSGGSPNMAAGGGPAVGGAGAAGVGLGGTSGVAGTAGTTGGMSSGGGAPCTPPQAAAGANSTCSPPTPPTAQDSVTLDMAVAQGAPTYAGSGFIYGISEDGTQPPTALLSDIKVKGFRAGRGVSTGCGQAAWDAHWKVIKGYYAKAKEMGVPLQILVSDDYQYSCPLPGTGGDWTTFTTFMTQLIAEVKAAGMTGPDVRWELWNEADYSGFWSGTQAQWLDTWKHAYEQVRAAIPGAIIEGPSLSSGAGGSWMNAFLDYCKTNNVMPDYITWHEAGGGGDPVGDLATINSALTSRGITTVKGFDLNEYGSTGEQNPGHSAWFLARFARAGIDGHAQQLGRRIAVLFEHGRPRGGQLETKQPVLDLQALRGSDRLANQRHRRNAGGRRGVSGCVRCQIHHRGGQSGRHEGRGERRHQEHPGLATERRLDEGPVGKDADGHSGAQRPHGRLQCRRRRNVQCDDHQHRLDHRHGRLRGHLEPALTGPLVSCGGPRTSPRARVNESPSRAPARAPPYWQSKVVRRHGRSQRQRAHAERDRLRNARWRQPSSA